MLYYNVNNTLIKRSILTFMFISDISSFKLNLTVTDDTFKDDEVQDFKDKLKSDVRFIFRFYFYVDFLELITLRKTKFFLSFSFLIFKSACKILREEEGREQKECKRSTDLKINAITFLHRKAFICFISILLTKVLEPC